jgi:hypothetical protein
MQSLSLNQAGRLVALGVGIYQLICAFEFFYLKHFFKTDGPWNRIKLKLPLLTTLLLIYIASAFSIILYPTSFALFTTLAISLFITYLIQAPFNGGADYIGTQNNFFILLFYLFKNFPHFQKTCLTYIAVNLVLSYVASGFYKVKSNEWQSGEILNKISHSSNFNPPKFLKMIYAQSNISRVLTYIVLCFEISSFFALNSKLTIYYLSFGLLFHLTNFFYMGLNRFFFAFLAGYPAVYFLAN